MASLESRTIWLVVLISVVSVLVMTAAVIAFSRLTLRRRSARRMSTIFGHLLQIPGKSTDLAMPFWSHCMILSICASIGSLLLALWLGRDFALAIGSIGIVILAMAIYVPLLATPRLIFRNTSIPVTLIFLLVPLVLPLLINATSLNESGAWPKAVCAAMAILGLVVFWKWKTSLGLALALLALLSFASLQNYSKVAYTITSTRAGKPERLQTPLRDEVSRWITAKRGDKRSPPYIFFVNTAGGGIRATYWTTSVLGRITDCSPQFPRSALRHQWCFRGKLRRGALLGPIAQFTQQIWRSEKNIGGAIAMRPSSSVRTRRSPAHRHLSGTIKGDPHLRLSDPGTE